MNAFKRVADDKFDPGAQVWANEAYTVHRRDISKDRDDSVVHLSIKRNDREPARDWRDFQQIKNELVGPEAEALELYPAESRLVDMANQYHLWAFKPPYSIPVGFNQGRKVMNARTAELLGARQRQP